MGNADKELVAHGAGFVEPLVGLVETLLGELILDDGCAPLDEPGVKIIKDAVHLARRHDEEAIRAAAAADDGAHRLIRLERRVVRSEDALFEEARVLPKAVLHMRQRDSGAALDRDPAVVGVCPLAGEPESGRRR